MAIFSAYFGTSGPPNEADVLTVAGYAATVNSWKRFEQEWSNILGSEGVTAFAAIDFACSQNEFATWQGEAPEKVERRRRFVASLSKCTKRSCAKFFRARLFIEDYERVDSKYRLSEAVGAPYALCSSLVAWSLRLWAHDLGLLHMIFYFYEDGNKDKGSFEEKHREAFGNLPQFLNKEDAIAFQAAEFTAWGMQASLHAGDKPNHTPEISNQILKSLSILDGLNKNGGILNEGSLLVLCEAASILKR